MLDWLQTQTVHTFVVGVVWVVVDMIVVVVIVVVVAGVTVVEA